MCNRNSWMLAAVLVAVEVIGGACQRASVPAPSLPAAAPATSPVTPVPGKPVVDKSRVVVQLTEEGFVPSRIPAEVGKPITLAITRKTDKTCAHEILFKGQPGKTDLPLDKEVEVTYTPKAPGAVAFGCAMGMMVGGALEVR